MALTLIPTFTPSGLVIFTAPPAPLPNSTSVLNPYGPVANTVALPVGNTPATVLINNVGSEAAAVLLTTAAATTTGTAASGSYTVTVASAASIAIGQAVIGVGISQGTFVQGISGTTITLTRPTIASLSTTALNFVAPVTLPPASGQTGAVLVPPMPAPPTALAYASFTFVSAISLGAKSTLWISVGV